MAQPPTQHPVRQRQGEDDVVGDVAQILTEFQETCDRVIQNLSHIPRPAGGGSPGSPGTPRTPGALGTPGTVVPPPNANTNIVRPTLEDMLMTIQFGMGQFIEERNRHMNDLQRVIHQSMTSIIQAAAKMQAFEATIGWGSQFVPQFIETWSGQALYFTDVYEACIDEENPLPNLRILNHPSPDISQDAYSELIWQVIAVCNHAERQMRLNEVMYTNLDEVTANAMGSLEGMLHSLRYFEDLSTNLHRDDQDLLHMFSERLRFVNDFLTEWQRGGDQLNLPLSSPQSPLSNVSGSSPGIPTARPQIPQPGPSGPQTPQPGSSSHPVRRGATPRQLFQSSPDSSIESPIEERQDRVRRLQQRAQMVEDIVQRYNELHGSVLHEVQSIIDQNTVLEQSLMAMENIPDVPDSP